LNTSLVSIVLVGAIIFYAAAVMITYESFAFYGALTLFLVGVSLIPLLINVPDIRKLTDQPKKRKKRR
jgi:hypothetical protein